MEKIDSAAQFHERRVFSGKQFLGKSMYCPAFGFTRESEELLTGEEARIGDDKVQETGFSVGVIKPTQNLDRFRADMTSPD